MSFPAQTGKIPRLRAPAPSVSPQLTWHCCSSCAPVAFGHVECPCSQALQGTALYLVLVTGIIWIQGKDLP